MTPATRAIAVRLRAEIGELEDAIAGSRRAMRLRLLGAERRAMVRALRIVMEEHGRATVIDLAVVRGEKGVALPPRRRSRRSAVAVAPPLYYGH